MDKEQNYYGPEGQKIYYDPQGQRQRGVDPCWQYPLEIDGRVLTRWSMTIE